MRSSDKYSCHARVRQGSRLRLYEPEKIKHREFLMYAIQCMQSVCFQCMYALHYWTFCQQCHILQWSASLLHFELLDQSLWERLLSPSAWLLTSLDTCCDCYDMLRWKSWKWMTSFNPNYQYQHRTVQKGRGKKRQSKQKWHPQPKTLNNSEHLWHSFKLTLLDLCEFMFRKQCTEGSTLLCFRTSRAAPPLPPPQITTWWAFIATSLQFNL